jgi:hypothetical protein
VLVLLCCKGGHFSSFNIDVALLSLELSPFTNLAAWHCHFASVFMLNSM